MNSCKDCGCPNLGVNFYFKNPSKKRKGYFSPYCKECDRKRSKVAKKTRYHDPVKGPRMKEKAKLRTDNPEYRSQVNAAQSLKYSENEAFRESLKDKMRQRRADAVEGQKIRDRAASYYQRNKSEIVRKASERQSANPRLRIRGYMRGRVSEAMEAQGESKGGVSSLKHLSYSWDDLYRHLEKKFEEWMKFSNYGAADNSGVRKWQIDHIVPQAFFPYDSMDSDLFRMCWSLENLRPLDSVQNFRDGDRSDLLGPVRDIREVFREVRELPVSPAFDGALRPIFDYLSSVGPAGASCSMGHVGLRYLDSIFSQRFRARTGRMPSVEDALLDDWRIFRALISMVQKGKHYSPTLVHSNLRFQVMGPGHFFPSAAASVIKAHLLPGGSMFDPFLGWGGRTLGAICSGVGRLVGCDLQDGIPESCKLMAADFSEWSGASTEFHGTDSLQFLKSSSEIFDLIFTSPPYLDSEDYGVESDSMRSDWIDSFVFPLAEQFRSHLSKGGKVALHLKDLKGAPAYSVYHSAMKAAGFSQVCKHRYSRTWSQAVYVYELVAAPSL